MLLSEIQSTIFGSAYQTNHLKILLINEAFEMQHFPKMLKAQTLYYRRKK